eukprot:2864908-Pleurochrysis_carterae.AAC.1
MAGIHASSARLRIPHYHASGARGHQLECLPPNPRCLALASDGDEHQNEASERAAASSRMLSEESRTANHACLRRVGSVSTN